ncbi:MAG TPA: protoheme IX farnesyltransferase [Thermodesulfobacteriota bacterium]|nr:protoheme IX farnesyltransferase [Thermodesulfobacteriota bacterium]
MKTTAVTLRGITLRPVFSLREWVNLLLDLAKIRISLLATFSTAAGYLLTTEKITVQMFVPTAAVFLLACGSCALNQYQEREIDQRMERTKSRPIPSGRMNPETALRISFGLILSGALTLFFGVGNLALALGLFAVLWYNWIYTPLKQKTAFAAVPGALVGAIPPVLGWVAGGGEILDSRIEGVALFFFMWQIPHFWLLLLDASRDYENAGFPSLTRIFSTEQMKGIIFIWLLSTGVSSLIIPLFGFLSSFIFSILLMAAVSWLFWSAVIFLRSHEDKDSLRATFIKLNIYAVLVISLLSADRLLRS